MREPIEKRKCATTKEEYINAAVSQIENDSDKHEAALELAAHIDDRIEYYKEIGFDEAQAAQKAVEQMGDPDAVTVPLSRLHPKGRVWTAVLAVLLFGLVLFIVGFYKFLYISTGVLEYGILEFLLLLCLIGLSLFGKKRCSRFLCALPMASFVFMYLLFILRAKTVGAPPLCSPIILTFFCLITGDFTCVHDFPLVSGITAAPWLTYMTYAFYIFIFIILILAFVSTCKLQTLYSLAAKKMSKRTDRIQKGVLVVCAVLVCSTLILGNPATGFPIHALTNYETGTLDFDVIVIMQSDRPCTLEEVRPEDILRLDSSMDWESFSYYIDTWESKDSRDTDTGIAYVADGEFVTVECGRKMTYTVKKDTVYVEVTKPYVYIGFLHAVDLVNGHAQGLDWENMSDFITLTEADWQKTESFQPICTEADPYNLVEVVINAS